MDCPVICSQGALCFLAALTTIIIISTIRISVSQSSAVTLFSTIQIVHSTSLSWGKDNNLCCIAQDAQQSTLILLISVTSWLQNCSQLNSDQLSPSNYHSRTQILPSGLHSLSRVTYHPGLPASWMWDFSELKLEKSWANLNELFTLFSRTAVYNSVMYNKCPEGLWTTKMK